MEPNETKVKLEDHDDIVDLVDSKSNTPADIVFMWHLEINRMFGTNIGTMGENRLMSLMRDYIISLRKEAINFEAIFELLPQVEKHMEHMYWLYADSDICFPETYLENMEHILTFYVNLTLRIILSMKIRQKVTQNKIKELTTKLIQRLSFYLLDSEYHIFHILIRQNTTLVDEMVKDVVNIVNSHMCKQVFKYLYFHFLLNKPLRDTSDEAYIRSFILFENWKAFEGHQQDKKIDECLVKLFDRTPESVVKNCQLFRKIFKSKDNVNQALIGAVGCDPAIIKAYFDHVRSKQRSESEILNDISKISIENSDWIITKDNDEICENLKELYKKVMGGQHSEIITQKLVEEDVSILDKPIEIIDLSDDDSDSDVEIIEAVEESVENTSRSVEKQPSLPQTDKNNGICSKNCESSEQIREIDESPRPPEPPKTCSISPINPNESVNNDEHILSPPPDVEMSERTECRTNSGDAVEVMPETVTENIGENANTNSVAEIILDVEKMAECQSSQVVPPEIQDNITKNVGNVDESIVMVETVNPEVISEDVIENEISVVETSEEPIIKDDLLVEEITSVSDENKKSENVVNSDSKLVQNTLNVDLNSAENLRVISADMDDEPSDVDMIESGPEILDYSSQTATLTNGHIEEEIVEEHTHHIAANRPEILENIILTNGFTSSENPSIFVSSDRTEDEQKSSNVCEIEQNIKTAKVIVNRTSVSDEIRTEMVKPNGTVNGYRLNHKSDANGAKKTVTIKPCNGQKSAFLDTGQTAGNADNVADAGQQEVQSEFAEWDGYPTPASEDDENNEPVSIHPNTPRYFGETLSPPSSDYMSDMENFLKTSGENLEDTYIPPKKNGVRFSDNVTYCSILKVRDETRPEWVQVNDVKVSKEDLMLVNEWKLRHKPIVPMQHMDPNELKTWQRVTERTREQLEENSGILKIVFNKHEKGGKFNENSKRKGESSQWKSTNNGHKISNKRSSSSYESSFLIPPEKKKRGRPRRKP